MNNLTKSIGKDEALKDLTGIKSCLDQLNSTFEKMLMEVIKNDKPAKTLTPVLNELELLRDLQTEFPIQKRVSDEPV